MSTINVQEIKLILNLSDCIQVAWPMRTDSLRNWSKGILRSCLLDMCTHLGKTLKILYNRKTDSVTFWLKASHGHSVKTWYLVIYFQKGRTPWYLIKMSFHSLLLYECLVVWALFSEKEMKPNHFVPFSTYLPSIKIIPGSFYHSLAY